MTMKIRENDGRKRTAITIKRNRERETDTERELVALKDSAH